MEIIKNLYLDICDKWIFYFIAGFSLVSCISIGASSIFLGIAILLFFYRISIKRDEFLIFKETSFNWSFILQFFCIALFLYLISGDVSWGIKEFSEEYIYKLMPLIIVMTMIKEKKQLYIILLLSVVSLLINSLGAIWQGVNGVIRASGPLNGIMVFSGILSMMIPLLVITTIKTEGFMKKSFFIALVISTVALLFNGTRSAWVTTFILSFITSFVLVSNKKKYILGILILTMAGSVIFSNVPNFNNRLKSIISFSDRSINERFICWEATISMFKDNPIIGIGIGNYREVYKNKYKPVNAHLTLHHAHNNFLQVLAEMGTLGFSSYLLMNIYFIYYGITGWIRKKNIYYLCFLTITLALLIHGMSDYNFAMSAVMKLYWLLTGIFIKMIYLTEKV